MFDDRTFRRVITVLGWAAMAFLVFPVLLTILVSFNGSQFIEFPPKSFSVDWYANIAKINKIGEATLLSLLIASLTGILTVAMAMPAAPTSAADWRRWPPTASATCRSAPARSRSSSPFRSSTRTPRSTRRGWSTPARRPTRTNC